MESTFTEHTFEIAIDRLMDPFEIVPLGDIHMDARDHDSELFDEVLDYLKKRSNVYVILMGDELDLASWSERKKLSAACLHESTLHTFDLDAIKRCDVLIKKLDFLRGRVIGAILGNHHYTFNFQHPEHGIMPGMTSTDYIAGKLGAKCLGFLSYIRLKVRPRKDTAQLALDVVACHGKAGGKLEGASINQVDDLRHIMPTADIYIMGHNHKKSANSVAAIMPGACVTGLRLRVKRQWLCRSGSFLRSYVPGRDAYSVKALFRPSELGIIRLECRVQRRRSGGEDLRHIDIHSWS